jgi:hypothetical protein
MRVPQKPFANYKWRWAVYTPTESLNDPPVFLGILRVLRDNENRRFSSEEVNDGLQIVQRETESTVNLVRSRTRNIFRNSGQYWKALGLLSDVDTRGPIILSPFGRKLAEGDLTQVEFATTVIQTLELPNRRIQNDLEEWDRAGLKFKPFEIVLDLIAALQERTGLGYLSPDELIKIVIPLAGDHGTLDEYVEAITLFRSGELNIKDWPDCAPESNDRRMAREFLLFLSNYGFCGTISIGSNMQERYILGSISVEEIDELYDINNRDQETDLERIERIIRRSQIPASIERKRVVREVLERPNQREFRRNILEAYRSTCIITGVQQETVLEAAHIKPVKHRGSDLIFNGICMRADVHRLFDANHLKILPNGNIRLSEEARKRENYGSLPTRIDIPAFVDPNQLDWRVKYY